MHSPGLTDGARILRRCRRSSRIGDIHPERRAIARLLFGPAFIILLALFYVGRIGSWLSDLEFWTERVSHRLRNYVESDREIEFHRRAWRRAHTAPQEGESHA